MLNGNLRNCSQVSFSLWVILSEPITLNGFSSAILLTSIRQGSLLCGTQPHICPDKNYRELWGFGDKTGEELGGVRQWRDNEMNISSMVPNLNTPAALNLHSHTYAHQWRLVRGGLIIVIEKCFNLFHPLYSSYYYELSSPHLHPLMPTLNTNTHTLHTKWNSLPAPSSGKWLCDESIIFNFFCKDGLTPLLVCFD